MNKLEGKSVAYQGGWHARQAGRDQTHNSYIKDSSFHVEWKQGWIDSDAHCKELYGDE